MGKYYVVRVARSLLKRFSKGNDGAAAVQFGLVAVPFLALIYCALQLFVYFLAQQMLETAAEAAGRQILVGNAASTITAFRTAVCSKVPAVLNCANIMVDVQVAASFSNATTTAPVLTYDSNGNVTNVFQYATGSSGSIVVLRLMYLWPMWNFFGFNPSNSGSSAHLMIATAVFQNE
jgi:Flp pilus assembly protein TadG